MRGVLREYRLDPANLDEVTRRISEAVPSVLQTIPGFVSYAINDPGDGRMVAFSVFEDASGTQESTRRAAEWARENLASFLPNPPTVTEGELRVREFSAKPRYGVLRRYHTEPRNIDTIVTRARDGFVPIVRTVPGFASYSILDAGNGTLITLSAFTSREGADESVRKAASWVRDNLGQLLPDPPEVLSGEFKLFVTSQEMSKQADRSRRRAA